MGRTQIGKNINDKDIALLAKFLRTLTGEYNGRSLAQTDVQDDDEPVSQETELKTSTTSAEPIDKEDS